MTCELLAGLYNPMVFATSHPSMDAAKRNEKTTVSIDATCEVDGGCSYTNPDILLHLELFAVHGVDRTFLAHWNTHRDRSRKESDRVEGRSRTTGLSQSQNTVPYVHPRIVDFLGSQRPRQSGGIRIQPPGRYLDSPPRRGDTHGHSMASGPPPSFRSLSRLRI